MNTAKTVTHLLFPLLIGVIIGGIVTGSVATIVCCTILLVVDILVGVALQHAIENATLRRRWQSLSEEERHALVRAFVEESLRNFPNDD